MGLSLVCIPFFISLRLQPKPSIIYVLDCSDTYWLKLEHLFPQSFQRAEISPSISSDSRKLVYILDANLLRGRSSSLSVLLGAVEEKPVLLVNIQESCCSLSVAKRNALTPVSALGAEITGLESQA